MKKTAVAAALALAGCVTTPAKLAETEVEGTILSAKTAEAFANCVVDNLPAGAQIRPQGEGYLVIFDAGFRVFRADFSPTATGSLAELRSTGPAKWNGGEVRKCAG